MELLWTSFIALMVVLVLTDLFVLRRPGCPESTTRSIGFATLWLVVAMAFNGLVYWIYDNNVFGAGKPVLGGAITAPDASLQFLSSYVLEWVLNIDSVFVIAAVFAHFRVREEHRHRLLMWGLLVALVFRGGLILTIGGLIHHLGWIRFVLAGLLIIAAIRMILIRQENLDANRSYVFRAIKWMLPISNREEGSRLVTTQSGKTSLTPLVVPLLLIETADAFLAMDSIPASYAFTREPFLIFCASALAMLSVRSMVAPLSRIIQRLRYFKIGQAMLLAYSAVIITMPVSQTLASMQTPGWSLSPLKKLAFVGVATVTGIVIAWVLGGESPTRTDATAKVSPLGPDADRFARSTLAHIRKIFVFVFGITGLIVGLVMAIGPGPGIPILFIALLVLASEFVWARVLVTKYRKVAEVATMKAAAEARKRFRPWVLIGLIMVEVIAAALIAIFTKVPTVLAITGVVPLIAGQLFLGYLAYVRKPNAAQPASEPSAPPTEPPSPTP
jgi:tellurite resistance protein TerC